MGARKPTIGGPKLEEKLLMAVKAVQKPEFKHVSSKHFAAAHAATVQGIERPSSPANPTSASALAWRPVTPDVQDTACKGDVPLGYEPTKAVEAALIVISKNLVKLNALVDISATIRRAGLILLEEAARAEPELFASIQASSVSLLAGSAAALWIAVKFMGVRATSPNAALMCQASQVGLDPLLRAEVVLLEALSWDIAAVIGRRGVPLG